MSAPYSVGDVVWGPDAYHDDDPELVTGGQRPWLILSNDAYPGHGEQYLCCAMTSGSGTGAAFVEVKPTHWDQGSMRKKSHIDTETVVTMKHHWITKKQGKVHRDIRQRARKLVISYIS